MKQYKNISHGEAVYYGMLAEAYISCKLGYLSQLEFNKISKLIRSIHIIKLETININELLSFIKYEIF